MSEFFSTFNGKDWLFLILTVLGIVISVEAIVNLRGKAKDWLATRNRKAFKKRCEQKVTQLRRAASFRTNSNKFFVHLIEKGLRGILLVLIAIGAFVLIVTTNPLQFSPAWDLLLPGTLLLFFTISIVADLWKETVFFQKPQFLIEETKVLLKKGLKKGWIDGKHQESIEPLLKLDLDALPVKSGNASEAPAVANRDLPKD